MSLGFSTPMSSTTNARKCVYTLFARATCVTHDVSSALFVLLCVRAMCSQRSRSCHTMTLLSKHRKFGFRLVMWGITANFEKKINHSENKKFTFLFGMLQNFNPSEEATIGDNCLRKHCPEFFVSSFVGNIIKTLTFLFRTNKMDFVYLHVSKRNI